jgi:hypothetical protein
MLTNLITIYIYVPEIIISLFNNIYLFFFFWISFLMHADYNPEAKTHTYTIVTQFFLQYSNDTINRNCF